MHCCVPSLVAVLAAAPVLFAGEPGARADYIGGTLSALSGKTGGIIHTTYEESLFFQTRKITIRVPYDKINLLEYGQKASRRFAMAILISPVLLLSKKREHYLTVGYSEEEGRQQAMVLRVDKDHVRGVLASLEAKTGLKVQYQDEEARRAGKS